MQMCIFNVHFPQGFCFILHIIHSFFSNKTCRLIFMIYSYNTYKYLNSVLQKNLAFSPPQCIFYFYSYSSYSLTGVKCLYCNDLHVVKGYLGMKLLMIIDQGILVCILMSLYHKAVLDFLDFNKIAFQFNKCQKLSNILLDERFEKKKKITWRSLKISLNLAYLDISFS